jgi:WhiB family redox-sensing transcriptional regulator
VTALRVATPLPCRIDPDLFFPDSYTSGPGAAQVEEAKAVCRGCHALRACHEEALADPHDVSHGAHGIRAALTPAERRALKTRTEAAA